MQRLLLAILPHFLIAQFPQSRMSQMAYFIPCQSLKSIANSIQARSLKKQEYAI